MDSKTIEAMTSHKNDNWSTPSWLVKKLENILSVEFDLDPCASSDNTKCSKFFTEQDDGLIQDWCGHNVFVNPPYSQIKKWAKKCYEEGQKNDTLVALLCPARTDTSFFHDYCIKGGRIIFIRGRIKFELPGQNNNSPLFPSMVVVFRGEKWIAPIISTMSNKP